MNSFELEQKLNSIYENPLSDARSLEFFSARENLSNILSTSKIHNRSIQSNILLNDSNWNINSNNKKDYSYITETNNKSLNQNPNFSFAKKNIEYDIKINALKTKLLAIKEINKNTQNNIQMIKIKIKKLQNEEKVSFRELEKTKKMLLKMRIKKEKNYPKVNSIKNLNINLTSINNNTLSFISNKNSSIINTNNNIKSQSGIFSKKKATIYKNNSAFVNMNKKRKINLTKNSSILSPRIKYFIQKNGTNNSFEIVSNNNIKPIHKPNFGIKTAIFKKNFHPQNKINYKNQLKKNIMKKLEEDEEIKRKIEEEIKLIEKEENELWNNFSENMYSVSTESKTNTNNTNDKKNKLYKNKDNDEEYENDNIVNYK